MIVRLARPRLRVTSTLQPALCSDQSFLATSIRGLVKPHMFIRTTVRRLLPRVVEHFTVFSTSRYCTFFDVRCG